MSFFRSTRPLLILLALSASFVILPATAQNTNKQIIVEGIEAPESANEVPRLVPPIGHVEAVAEVALTPDGRFALSAGWDQTLRLWEVSSGREAKVFTGHEGQVWTVAIAPDGRTAISSAGDHTLRMWDLITGQQTKTIPHQATASLKFLPDGKRVFGGDSEGGIYLLDTQSGEVIRDFMGGGNKEGDWVTSVAVSPNGKTGLTCGFKNAILWNLETGEKLRQLTLPKEADFTFRGAAFSPDGALIATTSGDINNGEIAVWNTATGEQVWMKTSRACQTIIFSRDGRFVFHEENGFLRGRDAKTGTSVGPETLSGNRHTHNINHLVFTADGTRLISASADQTLRVWSVANGGAKSVKQLTGSTNRVAAFALSPDGRQVLCGLDHAWTGAEDDDAVARVWDAGTGRTVRELPGHKFGVQAAAWSRNGQRIITAGKSSGIFVWDAANGQKLKTLDGNFTEADTVAINADGTRALAAISDISKFIFRLYDTTTGEKIKEFVTPKKTAHWDTNALLFHPDGKSFLSVTEDGTARLWNLADGRMLQSYYTGDETSLYTARFSPDGKTVALGGQPYVLQLWDVATGQQLEVLENLKNTVMDVAFSPDGRSLVSAGVDGKIILWDAQSGEEKSVFKGHLDRAQSVVFTASGRYILSAGWDNVIRLWDAQSGQEVLSYLILNNGDWLAYTPQGYFDGSPKGIQQVAFARGLQTYSLEQFSEQFYRPNLIALALRGEGPSTGGVQATAAQAVIQGAPPLVRIVSPQTGAAAASQVEVTVEAREQNKGGVKAIRLYLNGRLVGGPGQLRGIVVEAAAPVAAAGATTQKFTVALMPGDNIFRAVAYSNTDLESRPDEVKLTLAAKAGDTIKPALRVLAVGINEYRDATMNLAYARPDAEALAQFFEAARKNNPLFSTVTVNKLVDEAATGEAIKGALGQLAAQSKPEDVVFIYMAGHGETAGPEGRDEDPEAPQNFYFLPADMRQMMMKERVRQFGISGKAIDDLVAKIPARKIVLIYDACKSGAAISGGTRGAGDEQQALAQLARSQGIFVLTASTGQQYANEVKSLGHGILTYALLEGLGGKAAGADAIVKVNGLFAYTDDRVPTLAKQYRGREQWPVSFGKGQNFPLVVKP